MTDHPLYRYFVENLREVTKALATVSRLARLAIARQDPENNVRSLIRLYSFLLGAWAETRLRKLVYERNGLSDDERTKVLSAKTQFDQWLLLAEVAFRRNLKLSKAPLNRQTMGVVHHARYSAILDIFNSDLRIIIEIRNKLAHGQWIYPFNNDVTKVEQDKYLLINKENIQSLQFKYAMLSHLSDIAHDLVSSPPTFERDFELHFRKLEQTRINLKKRNYSNYEHSLINSRQKYRNSSANNTPPNVTPPAVTP